MLYLTCTTITSVDLAHYGVSRAEDWVSVDCGTTKFIVYYNLYHPYHKTRTLARNNLQWARSVLMKLVLYTYTENTRNNDSVCYQRFCCKTEFAVIKKVDRTHLKHQSRIHLISFIYYKSYVLCIC